MRVIECNFCGEVVSGANDDDLAGSIRRHMDERHPETAVDEQQAREMVDRDAYDATDS